jgi:ribosomal protein L11 methyltransferase
MLTEFSLVRRKRQGMDSAEAFDCLISCGIDPRRIVESDSKSALRVSVFLAPARARKIAGRIEKLRPKGWSVRSRLLENKDWLTKWQKAFDIAPVGRRFVIVPLWKKEKYKNAGSARIPLYFDPQGSFGSGTHATTRSIIEILEGLKPAPGNFLDVGTGTGILLMAAGKCGIKKLCGTDNDPRALKTARHNLRLNDLRAQLLRADAVTMKKLGSYDVVAANLLSKTLVDSRKTLAGMVRTGGLLIVSGIERRNLRWFLENFKVPGLKRQKIQVRGGWAAVLYLKSKKRKK